MSKPNLKPCPGCDNQFEPKPDAICCPACVKTVKVITFTLSALETQKLEAQAVIRGCSVGEVVRQAVAMLFGKPKNQRRFYRQRVVHCMRWNGSTRMTQSPPI
jgi:predicted amidophosphoribosyltransferase